MDSRFLLVSFAECRFLRCWVVRRYHHGFVVSSLLLIFLLISCGLFRLLVCYNFWKHFTFCLSTKTNPQLVFSGTWVFEFARPLDRWDASARISAPNTVDLSFDAFIFTPWSISRLLLLAFWQHAWVNCAALDVRCLNFTWQVYVRVRQRYGDEVLLQARKIQPALQM